MQFVSVCFSNSSLPLLPIIPQVRCADRTSAFSVEVSSWARRVLCAGIGCDSAGSRLCQTWSDFSHAVDHVAGALADVSDLADMTRAHGYSGSGSAVGHRTHQFPPETGRGETSGDGRV